MRIPCPLCGSRDSREFTPWGDALLRHRPDGTAADAAAHFHDYVHIRPNPAGAHRELWYHDKGCGAWLVVARNTVTHEVTGVTFAAEDRT